jgi:excinuclease ABC subunit C
MNQPEHFRALKEASQEAPAKPGVYLFRNGENAVIYVGKARVLRSRLASYFSGVKDVKTAALLRHSRSIETFIVSNEYEALLLENTLIKQHSPRYNINLKDGKTYPVIRITREEFPRVFRTRHIVEDGSLYFGPFPNIQAVDKLLELVDKLFPLRKCRILRKRTAPCMYYHIRRCTAPCCGKISPEDYAVHVGRIQRLLSENSAGRTGEREPLVMELTEKMREAAAGLQFERAAEFRNTIRAIEELSLPISVSDRDTGARDYIAWASEGVFTAFAVLSMRGGRMTGKDVFSALSAAE